MTATTNDDVSPVPDEAGGGTDRVRRRQRIIWMVAVLALFAVGVAAGPAWFQSDRFYRFDWVPVWAPAACWTAAVLLLAVARVGPRRSPGQLAVAATLGLVLVPVWAVSMFVHSFVAEESKVVAVAVSPDGSHEVVTESHKIYNHPPGCRVLLRERDGLFSRQTTVWNEDECPQRVSFTGDATISLTKPGSGKVETTTFDPQQMQVGKIYGFA
ncbi:hypothetical protein [Nocardia sp. CS682]|uniref:hypothetical protein n=1 Tax=Nocardia sp. CS682 TaxID=1047172 RepID=UPI0010757176|nr:hypothetical protein [Nocardia sp. CS682]